MGGRYVAVLLAWALAGSAVAAELHGAMLLYQVTEPDLEPYTSRIMVTPAYLRMDDGSDDSGYLLFDRQSKVIYSVSHGDRTVLEVHPQPVTAAPPLRLQRAREEVTTPEPLPLVAGRQPHQYRLTVNGAVCYNLITVAGVMDDAVAALRAYRLTLAGENARVLPQVPAEMQDPCDLALNTFAPQWQLEFGLPIREWWTDGRSQQLLDFTDDYPMDAGLLRLPPDYQHYTPGTQP